MPSGKRAKQQRRVAPPAPVRGQGGPGGVREASPKALAIAGGVILLVIVAIVLAIVLSNGGGGSTGGSGQGDAKHIILASGTPAVGNSSDTSHAVAQAPDVATMFKDIPQSGFVLGDANAPVTLVEWIDTQCPVCQAFETTILPTLVSKYVKTGKLKIELKVWNILDAAHGTVDSYRGQEALIAAAQQNKAFQFAEILYDNQGLEGTNWMNDAQVSTFAASIDGLDTVRWMTDANASSTASLISQTDNYAAAHYVPNAEFSGTPTLFLAKGIEAPQFYLVGLPSLTGIEAAIQSRLPK